MLKRKRGVSEVVGALILAAITVSVAVVYISMATGYAGRGATSLADIMRTAERRQGQLLSAVYCCESGGNVMVYIYNYGTVSAAPVKVIVNGAEVAWTMKNADTGALCTEISPDVLVELSFPKPSTNPFDLIITSPEGIIVSWRLSY
jgi:flagellin-like protein